MRVKTYIKAFLDEEEAEGRPIPDHHLNIFMGYMRSHFGTFRINEESNYLELSPFVLTMFLDYMERNSLYEEEQIVKSIKRFFVAMGYRAKHVDFALARKGQAKRRPDKLPEWKVDKLFKELDRTTFTDSALKKRIKAEEKKKKGKGEL